MPNIQVTHDSDLEQRAQRVQPRDQSERPDADRRGVEEVHQHPHLRLHARDAILDRRRTNVARLRRLRAAAWLHRHDRSDAGLGRRRQRVPGRTARQNPPTWNTIGIAIYKSTDGGQTWSAPKLSTQSAGDDKQWAAGDANPAARSTATCTPSGTTPRHRSLRAHEGSRRDLDRRGQRRRAGTASHRDGSLFPEINVAADGTIYVVSIAGSEISCRLHRRRRQFSASRIPATGITTLGRRCLSAGRLSRLPGGNFRVLTDPTACAFGSTVIVAWADFREGVSRIYYAHSTDRGTTWTTGASGQPLLTGVDPAELPALPPADRCRPERRDRLRVLRVRTEADDAADRRHHGAVVRRRRHVQSLHRHRRAVGPDRRRAVVARQLRASRSSATTSASMRAPNGFFPLWTDTRTGIQELLTAIVPGAALRVRRQPEHASARTRWTRGASSGGRAPSFRTRSAWSSMGTPRRSSE